MIVPLFRKRPTVKLLTPAELVPGEVTEVAIVVDCKEAIDIDGITMTVTGKEHAGVGSGKSRSSASHRVLGLAYQIHPGGALEPGSHRFPARLVIPPNAPPTYQGNDARADYEARVHIDIPWWPDVRRRYGLRVGFPRPEAPPPSRGVVFTSNPAGPSDGAPHFEASLASGVLVPGDRVRGAFAVANTANNRYKGFKLTLIGRETRRVPSFGRVRTDNTVLFRLGHYWALAAPLDGEPIPFELELPRGVFPTARATLWSYDWVIEVEVDVSWALNKKLEFPLIVTPEPRSGEQRLHAAIPSVGSRRVARIWDEVAQLVGMTAEQGRLRTQVGDVSLEIGSEFEGKRPILVARLAYPDLGLELSIRRAKDWSLGRDGLDVGDGEWEKAHIFGGRDVTQVAPFVAAIRQAMAKLTVRAVDDECAFLYLRASPRVPSEVELFARQAREAARALSAASAALPLPARATPHADAWAELARRLEGKLHKGAVAVRGTYLGLEAEVATGWTPSGEAGSTTVTVRSRAPLDPSRAPDEPGLTVTEDAVTLRTPPLLDDPLGALEHLRRAADLAETLAGGGPYR